jgi:hypothetical protein
MRRLACSVGASRHGQGEASVAEYAVTMEQTSPGDLVSVSSDGPDVDGIVFDVPSRAKVVVALVDPSRGPVLRTVAADALSERDGEAAGDRALRMLIKRTPSPVRGPARGGANAGRGNPGHARGTMHRTTGK